MIEMSNKKTVLVISNGPEQFTLAASMLADDGYCVLFENDLGRGLRVAQAAPPRLIISELAVPNVDGLELCCRTRGDKGLGTTPILLVGDLSRQSSIVGDSLRCGAADYLQKPIDQLALVDLCRGMVGPQVDQTTAKAGDNLFTSLIENISDVVTIIDPDGKILFESPSTQRILGYEPGELLGQNTFDLIHPADLAEVSEYLNSVHWGIGLSTPVDYRIRRQDGSWQLMESTAVAVEDPRFGSATVVTSHEITETASSLDPALRNDVLRNALFDNAANGIALFTASGRLVEGNIALLNMFDHPGAGLHGMHLSEFLFPRDGEKDRAAVVELITGRRSEYRFENGYLTPEGERTWGGLSLVAVGSGENGPQFLIGIFDEPRIDEIGADGSPARTRSTDNSSSTVADFAAWKIERSLISKN